MLPRDSDLQRHLACRLLHCAGSRSSLFQNVALGLTGAPFVSAGSCSFNAGRRQAEYVGTLVFCFMDTFQRRPATCGAQTHTELVGLG